MVLHYCQKFTESEGGSVTEDDSELSVHPFSSITLSLTRYLSKEKRRTGVNRVLYLSKLEVQ